MENILPKRLRAVTRGKEYQWVRLAASLLGLSLLIAASSVFENVIAGEIAIGVYGLLALVLKAPSATAFKMAIVMLVFIPIVGIIQGTGSLLGETFAVYAFLLLVVGTVLAIAELWRDEA